MKEYEEAHEKLKDLAVNFLSRCTGGSSRRNRAACLVVELGKMMEEFKKRVEEM